MVGRMGEGQCQDCFFSPWTCNSKITIADMKRPIGAAESCPGVREPNHLTQGDLQDCPSLFKIQHVLFWYGCRSSGQLGLGHNHNITLVLMGSIHAYISYWIPLLIGGHTWESR